jgi:hypothetical protein
LSDKCIFCNQIVDEKTGDCFTCITGTKMPNIKPVRVDKFRPLLCMNCLQDKTICTCVRSEPDDGKLRPKVCNSCENTPSRKCKPCVQWENLSNMCKGCNCSNSSICEACVKFDNSDYDKTGV